MRVIYTNSKFLALCALPVWGATAFSFKPDPLFNAPLAMGQPAMMLGEANTAWDLASIAGGPGRVQRCEGQTRKTFDFPDTQQEVAQVGVSTEGRPLHAEIQLWVGPNYTPLNMKVFSEDGQRFPVQTLIGTRKKSAQIEVRNIGPYEMPISVASSYAMPELAEVRYMIPDTLESRIVQGGGAVYSIPLDPGMSQVRVFLKTDGRQLKARIELLNGPNNVKQAYELYTSDGVKNAFYAVFNTPGSGNTLRITNLSTVEFPAYAYITPV